MFSATFGVGVVEPVIGSLAAGLIADGVRTPYVFLSAAFAVLLGSAVFVVRTFHPMPEPVTGA